MNNIEITFYKDKIVNDVAAECNLIGRTMETQADLQDGTVSSNLQTLAGYIKSPDDSDVRPIVARALSEAWSNVKWACQRFLILGRTTDDNRLESIVDIVTKKASDIAPLEQAKASVELAADTDSIFWIPAELVENTTYKIHVVISGASALSAQGATLCMSADKDLSSATSLSTTLDDCFSVDGGDSVFDYTFESGENSGTTYFGLNFHDTTSTQEYTEHTATTTVTPTKFAFWSAIELDPSTTYTIKYTIVGGSAIDFTDAVLYLSSTKDKTDSAISTDSLESFFYTDGKDLVFEFPWKNDKLDELTYFGLEFDNATGTNNALSSLTATTAITHNEWGEFVLAMDMPGSFNAAVTSTIKSNCHRYMVDYVMAAILKNQNMDNYTKYLGTAEIARKDISRSINARKVFGRKFSDWM